MTVAVCDLWRYPIKSHGRESLSSVLLCAGKTMPWDRVWAVAHEAAKFDDTTPEWVSCANFSRGAKAPSLMAINASVDEGANLVTLTHPDLPKLTFNPDLTTDAARFIAWVMPISPTNRALPARLVSVADRGMTDTEFPSVSINSLASLRDLQDKAGTGISRRRWRGNIWLDGSEPWEEFNWIGRRIRIGKAELVIRERIKRCLATTANPRTGKPDIDTLAILSQNWGHKDFGIYGEIIKTGAVSLGDKIELL